MNQSTIGERVTALVSTLIAVAILGAAVTAHQGSVTSHDRLATLESDLRFQLDLAYRQNGELPARLAELDRTLAAYHASPRSPRDHERLADWLRTAIRHTIPGQLQGLPQTPAFGTPPPATEPASAAASAPAASTKSQPRSTTAARPAPHTAARGGQPAQRAAAAKAATTPNVVRQAPRTSPSTSQPRPAQSAAAPAPQTTTPPAPAAREPLSTAAAAPSQVLPTPKPAAPPATADPLPAPALVEINLRELNARVAGYHAGLDEIEAALVAGRQQRTPDDLVDLVDKLEQLALQYRFVRLYYEALSPAERKQVPAPRAMSPTVAMVEHEWRVAVAGAGDFLSPFEVAQGPKARNLDGRLKSIADAVRE